MRVDKVQSRCSAQFLWFIGADMKFMKLFFSQALFLALMVGSVSARADLLTDCNQTASEVNRSTPQVLDNITTLLNAICFKDGGAVTLSYRNRLSVNPGAVTQANLNNLRPGMVNSWCTDPDMRALINQVNIQYTYSDAGGRFVGKIDLSRRDCR